MGAWWTGQAIQSGDSLQTLLRLFISISVGLYYLLLWQIVVRPRLLGLTIDLRDQGTTADNDVIDLR